MKKVSIISQGLSNGGAERVASIIANYLSDKGYEVQYIAVYNSKKQYQLNKNIKYTYIDVLSKNKIQKFILRSKKIAKNIQNFNPDAILSFLCNETLFIKNKSKIIYSLRNDPKNTEKNKLFKFLRNYLYSKGRKVVFQTSEAMNYFSTKIKKKGIIILNPVESDKLPHWEDCNHENRIITACRLTKQKNLEMLIKAFSKLKKIYKNELKLEIYGEGEEKDNLENLIKKLKLQNYVFLQGYSNSIHELIAHSKIFVLSSDYEGLSNSMLESLCIGIPCVCTDCPPGGARMVIDNDQNGILVPVGDSENMALSLKKILDNEEIGKNFNKKNKKYREILLANNICQQWENVIKE